MNIHDQIKAHEADLAHATDPAEQAVIVMDILRKYVSLRSIDGMPYSDRMLQLGEQLGDDSRRAWAIYTKGIFMRFKGDYAASLDLSAQARAIFERLDHVIGISNSYNNDALVYYYQGQHTEALRNYWACLEIAQQTSDKTGEATAYNNIALVYEDQGNLDEAMLNNQRALALMLEINDRQGLANCYTNIGNIHFKKGNLDEALRNHKICLRIETESGNEFGMAIAKANIASVYRDQGRYDDAMQNSLEALEIFEAEDGKQYIALLRSQIGTLHYRQGHYADAMRYQAEAIKIAEEVGAKEEIRVATLALSETAVAMGDFEAAYHHYKRYTEVNNEMVGQQAQKQFMQLTFQHNIELKEKEAQLLKEKNDAISSYAHKLEISNNELKQFAHVASHDLREPLRMVSTYMQLLDQNLGTSATELQRQFITFAVDGAGRMETLIHDLLHLAKVDADPRIERVSLIEVIDDVRSNLEMLIRDKGATLTTDVLPAIMADRTQIMQLFQNLIGNGIKYNESPSPTITIGCEMRAEGLALRIADNGIGIPEEYRERAFQLFQRVPTAQQYSGTGIGLAICKKIVEGLGGTISIVDHPGGGSVFAILLPATVVAQ